MPGFTAVVVADPRARDRRQQRDLQRGERRAPAAAALRPARRGRHHLGELAGQSAGRAEPAGVLGPAGAEPLLHPSGRVRGRLAHPDRAAAIPSGSGRASSARTRCRCWGWLPRGGGPSRPMTTGRARRWWCCSATDSGADGSAPIPAIGGPHGHSRRRARHDHRGDGPRLPAADPLRGLRRRGLGAAAARSRRSIARSAAGIG